MQRNSREHALPDPDAAPLFLRMPTVLRVTGLGARRSTASSPTTSSRAPCDSARARSRGAARTLTDGARRGSP